MKKPAEKPTRKAGTATGRAGAGRQGSQKADPTKPVAAKSAASAKAARPVVAKEAAPKALQPAPAALRKAAAPVSAEAIAAGEALIARFSRHSSHRSVAAAVSKRPFFLRRDPMENIATAIIGMGFLMMFQPFVMQLYSWSFVTMLFGTVMFIIVSKFPE
jgi:hypothetical protein